MMEKLVLQEIWTDLLDSKLKKPYNYMLAIVGIAIWIMLLSSTITDKNTIIVIAFVIILSNYMLKSNISDCIYIIPGSVREYIKAKYRLAVIIELLTYVVLVSFRYVICILSDNKITDEFVTGQLFLTVAFILYVLVKNTWLLYINFSIRELQDYKCAQGLSLFWFLCIELLVEISEEKITGMVPLTIGITAVAGFAAYAVYICIYVKKNLIIKTYK